MRLTYYIVGRMVNNPIQPNVDRLRLTVAAQPHFFVLKTEIVTKCNEM